MAWALSEKISLHPADLAPVDYRTPSAVVLYQLLDQEAASWVVVLSMVVSVAAVAWSNCRFDLHPVVPLLGLFP